MVQTSQWEQKLFLLFPRCCLKWLYMAQSNPKKKPWSKCSAITFQLSPQNCSFFSRVQEKPIWCQTAWRLLMCVNLTRLLPKATIFLQQWSSALTSWAWGIYFPSPEGSWWVRVSFCCFFTASDANWGSGGGREGHLRATVVVQFARACAAYHPSVRVRSSVRVSVPEAPDVALWADRWSRVDSGILNVRSQSDQ